MIQDASRKESQLNSHKKMKALYQATSTLEVGKVVSVSVPKTLRSRQRLLQPTGIILKVSNNKNTCVVAVKGGVLTEPNGSQSWIPHEKLTVLDSDAVLTLSEDLRKLLPSIREGKFCFDALSIVDIFWNSLSFALQLLHSCHRRFYRLFVFG